MLFTFLQLKTALKSASWTAKPLSVPSFWRLQGHAAINQNDNGVIDYD